MSRSGITNLLISDPRTHETIRSTTDDPDQFSMFHIFDANIPDDHETTYQLISPSGDIIDLTFTTNDSRAFDNWCKEEGLNPDKVHAIAKEGLNSAYKDWFVKIIDNPVVIPEKDPEPVVKEKPKKQRRKRKAKAKTKAKAAEKKSKQKLADYKPEPVPVESNAEYLTEKDTTGWHQTKYPRALKKDASVWKDAEEVPVPVNRKQRRAAKKKSKRR